MNRQNKYPNGYLPKIQYWAGELNKELANGTEANRHRLEVCSAKLDYFSRRERERVENLDNELGRLLPAK